MRRLLLASTHAGLTASIGIVAREAFRPDWTYQIDFIFVTATAASTFGLWWRYGRNEFDALDAAEMGLKVAAVATLGALLVVMLSAGQSGWMLLGPQILLLLTIAFGAWIVTCPAAVAAGLLAGLLFDKFVQPERQSGPILGLVLAVASAIVPIGAIASRLVLGLGFIEMVAKLSPA
jgi:hypothetical protein